MIWTWWKKRRERRAEEDRLWVDKAMQELDAPREEVMHAVFNEPSEYDDDEPEYYDHDAAYQRERRRSRVGMLATFAMVGVFFGLALVGLNYLANSADKAGPQADSGMEALKASIAPTPTMNPQLNGTQITFTYPAVFDVVTHPAAWANTNERYALSSKTDYRKTIQVYVEQVGDPTLDSGYLVRAQHTKDYTPAPIKVQGEPAVVMVKNDLSERTLYWEHKGNLVIMSATGAGGDMATWLSVIANSLRWTAR